MVWLPGQVQVTRQELVAAVPLLEIVTVAVKPAPQSLSTWRLAETPPPPVGGGEDGGRLGLVVGLVVRELVGDGLAGRVGVTKIEGGPLLGALPTLSNRLDLMEVRKLSFVVLPVVQSSLRIPPVSPEFGFRSQNAQCNESVPVPM